MAWPTSPSSPTTSTPHAPGTPTSSGFEPYFVRDGYVEFRLGDHHDELGIVDRRYAPDTGWTRRARSSTGTSTTSRRRSGAPDRLGATVHDGIRERGHGFTTASVTDPFGNVLGRHVEPQLGRERGASSSEQPPTSAQQGPDDRRRLAVSSTATRAVEPRGLEHGAARRRPAPRSSRRAGGPRARASAAPARRPDAARPARRSRRRASRAARAHAPRAACSRSRRLGT